MGHIMRRISIWKTLTVIMVLLSLATGMCFAKDAENLTKIWEEEIETNRPGEKAKYYIDEAKTQVIDYSGRKYLQLYIQKNKVFMEQFWFVLTWREDEKAHWTIIYDVAQHKAFISEFMDKDSKQKEGRNDISLMLQNSSKYSNFDKKIMDWMIDNRRSVLENVILENGDEPESIDYNYVSFKEQLQQKREQYKDDLKKLNDAVYIHNNASDFTKKNVYEADNLINDVVGKIRDNESGKLYQELISQEVRNTFETGVYKQQYEQLKADVEAEQAAQLEQQRAIAKVNGINSEGIPLYRAADAQEWENEHERLDPTQNYDLSKNIYVHFLKRPILLNIVHTETSGVIGFSQHDSIEAVAGYVENVSNQPISLNLCRAIFDGEKYENLGLEMDKTTAKYYDWRWDNKNKTDGILLDYGYFDVRILPHDRIPFIMSFEESDLPNGKWTSDMKNKAIDREVHCEAFIGDFIREPSNETTKNILDWAGEKYWSAEELLKLVDDAFVNQ